MYAQWSRGQKPFAVLYERSAAYSWDQHYLLLHNYF